VKNPRLPVEKQVIAIKRHVVLREAFAGDHL